MRFKERLPSIVGMVLLLLAASTIAASQAAPRHAGGPKASSSPRAIAASSGRRHKRRCKAGSKHVRSAAAVTRAVSHHRSVCVTARVGNVGFIDMGNRRGVVVSTKGGSMGQVEIDSTSGLTIRSARFRSVTIRHGNHTSITGSRIGGTRRHRVYDELIFLPDRSDNVRIAGNDIGWTLADDSGNTGYGCRCYGQLNGLRFVRNRVHDIAADGFQGVNGRNVVIDRNEIGPVGANPGSSEHSDLIQIVSNGSHTRITNNWLHNQGYFSGRVVNNAGSTYIHGGSKGSLLYQNNLISNNQGRTDICGLGTGGNSRSNLIIRRNTWVNGGLAYPGFPSLAWYCSSGKGNVVARNIAIDPDGGFAMGASHRDGRFSRNIWGRLRRVRLNANGTCVSRRCHRHGRGRIGYRKPSHVRW